VELCTSLACGPLGLRRIWTVSHDYLDYSDHRLRGRCLVARRESATSVASLGALRNLCPLYPQKADIGTQPWNACFVPKAEVGERPEQ